MKKQFNDPGARPLIRKESGSLVYQEDIKRSITVVPELEALIPPLSAEEFTQLETNILREGCREPLQIWQTVQSKLDGSATDKPVFVLIDGHNRLRICRQHSIDFKLLVREFSGLDAVRESMIDNQLGRRNLTAEQMAYLRGLKYLSAKRTTGRPASAMASSGQPTVPPLSTTATTPQQRASTGMRTEDQLAQQYQVSPKTIRLDASYAKGMAKLAEPFRREVLSRQTKVLKKDIIELGESDQIDGLIETPAQLQSVLTYQSITSDPSTNPRVLAGQPERTKEIQRQIATVVRLATALERPDADLKSLSQQLLNQVQQLITYW